MIISQILQAVLGGAAMADFALVRALACLSLVCRPRGGGGSVNLRMADLTRLHPRVRIMTSRYRGRAGQPADGKSGW